MSGVIPDDATIVIEDYADNIVQINNLLNYVSADSVTFGQMKQVMLPYDITDGRYRWIFDATYNEATTNGETVRVFNMPATVVTPRTDVVQIVTNAQMLDAVTAESWTGSDLVTPSDDDGYAIGHTYRWNSANNEWVDTSVRVEPLEVRLPVNFQLPVGPLQAMAEVHNKQRGQ